MTFRELPDILDGRRQADSLFLEAVSEPIFGDIEMRLPICLGCVAVILCLLSVSTSQGEMIYSWSASPTVTDGTDNSLKTGQDIYEGVWFAADSQYYYFRMDLRETPSMAGSNYAGIYGIYIDYQPGGGDHGDTQYIPSGLMGIDYIVDSHFNSASTGGFDASHVHYDWNEQASSFSLSSPVDDQQTDNTLEWKILRSDISEPFTVWAATHDSGESAPTYDVTPDVTGPGYTVPEPASAIMLCIGALMFLAGGRRRSPN